LGGPGGYGILAGTSEPGKTGPLPFGEHQTMPIEFRCTQCDRLLRTPDGTGGKEAKCPQCGALVRIPEAAPPVAPPPAPHPFSASTETGNPYQSPSAVVAAPQVRGFHPTRIDLADVMSRAWRIYKLQLWPLVGTVFLYFIISVAIGAISGAILSTIAEPRTPAFVFLNNVISNAIGIFLSLGLLSYLLKSARGENATVADLFSGAPFFLQAIGGSILFGLAVLGGLVLLIIPGIIIALMFSVWMPVLIDQRVGVIDSLRYSAQATKGNKLTIFAVGIVASGLVLALTVVTCFVGFFFVYPYAMLLFVVTYLAMTGQSTIEQFQPAGSSQ
jgi:uncharacterized membrane protein/phage FluMu protein Com